MFDSKEYIKRLIKESMEEAFGKKNAASFDDFDVEDEYSSGDESNDNEPEKSNVQNNRGKGFQGGQKYMKNKSSHNAALDRMRSNLPYNDDAFSAPWMDNSDAAKNPYNKSIADPLSADVFGRIKVKAAQIPNPKSDKYKEPLVVIDMLNIDSQDCVEIAKRFAKYGHTMDVTVPPTRQNNTRDGVQFIVLDRSVEQWKEEDLEQILDFIGSFKNEDGSPKYFRDEQDKENVRQYVSNRVMTGSDVGQYFMTAKKNNIELFNAFIEAESDEKVEEFIKMYQRFNLSNMLCAELGLPVTFGRILSTQNASLVLGSRRMTGAGVTPTFILTERMWREKFGRVVNPNAVPYPIWVPSRRFVINKMKDAQFTSRPYVTKDTSGQDVEISKTSDVLNVFFLGKKWDELSEQQKISANIMCNFINPSECYMVTEYDVSDTTLVDPNGPDKFKDEIGLANRFSGEFNEAAANFIKTQNLIAKGDDTSETGGNEEDSRINAFNATLEQLNEYALKNVDEYCSAKGISYPKNPKDVSQSLINAMKIIAKQHISLRKDSNVEVLVNDAVYATCKVMKIGLDLLNTLRIGKPTNDIEFSQYQKAFSVLMDVINGNWKNYNAAYKQNMANVSESIENKENNPFADKKYTPEELKILAAKALPSDKVRTDMFESLLERMDNSKRNLIY